MFGGRKGREEAPGAWQTFVEELTPPYEVEKVLSAALALLSTLFSAGSFAAYARDPVTDVLRLRVTRNSGGMPTVGPNYAGLITGAPVRPAPLEVSRPGDPETCVIEKTKNDTRLTLALGYQVVLTADARRGRKLTDDERSMLVSFSRRARPVMDLVLYIDGLSRRVEAASLGASTNRRAAEIALNGERLLSLVVGLGAEVVHANVGFLVSWKDGQPKILWETREDQLTKAFQRAVRLREVLPGAPGHVAVRGAAKVPDALRALGIQGLFTFQFVRGGLVLGASVPPAASEHLKVVLPVLLRSVGLVLGTDERAKEATKYLKTLFAAVDLVDASDPYNQGHSEMVAEIAADTAREMGLDPEQVEAARLAGRLHDLGMVAVSLDLPLAKGALTDQQRRLIQVHPEVAVDLLAAIPPDVLPPAAVEAVATHHERMDGHGYPKGLSGQAIPILGRIVGASEQYVARISTRSYREALPAEQALQMMQKLRGSQLDSEVVQALIRSQSRAASTTRGA